MAQNFYEQPDYGRFLAHNVEDMRRPIADETVKNWQRTSMESILLHHGSEVICAKLNPKEFLLQGSTRNCENVLEDAGLENFRRVDVHETGRALPLGHSPGWYIPRITCMCQHQGQRQTFATSDEYGVISVWRWLGTDDANPEKYAVKVMGALRLDTNEVHGMCFLSNSAIPSRIHELAGVVLFILNSRHGALWLDVFAVYQAFARLESTQRVENVRSSGRGVEALQADVDVCFLTNTNSGKLLVLGGAGILKVWQVMWNDHSTDSTLKLSLVEDLASTFRELKDVVLTSCLSVPLKVWDSRKPSDYIVCGDSAGKLYGFKFDMRESGRFMISETPGSCGRFRSNSHTRGIPIRQLVGCYGTEIDSHHGDIKGGGVPYSRFLNKVPIRHDLFYSLAADGWLLAWRFLEQGWRSTPMCQFPFLREAALLADVVGEHVAEGDMQLSLRIGDQVVVIEDVNGWAGGHKVGHEDVSGWFPRNCVREVPRTLKPLVEEDSAPMVACHSSRLLPNVLVLFDQNAGRFRCYDARKEIRRREMQGTGVIGGG